MVTERRLAAGLACTNKPRSPSRLVSAIFPEKRKVASNTGPSAYLQEVWSLVSWSARRGDDQVAWFEGFHIFMVIHAVTAQVRQIFGS